MKLAWQATLLLASSVSPLAAQTLGTAFTYQGQLKQSGQPANELYDLQVCLFDDAVNPVALVCAPDFNDVPVEGGLFTITLDFGATAFAGQQRFLELRVRAGASGGAYTTLAPRQLVRPAPEALRANVASTAPWAGLTGVPAGFADNTDNNSGGTVTSVTGGTGLSGGTITGSGTLAIASGGVGLAQIDSGQVQARVSGNCGLSRYLRQVNADGTVVCGTDASGGTGTGTVTSITAGAGLSGGTITDSGTLAVNTAVIQSRVTGTCALGSYLRGVNADGSALCSDLPGVTTITTVDEPVNSVGEFTSIAIGSDGLAVISYFDLSAGNLKVAKCANAACSGAATITTVDPLNINVVGRYTSIAIGSDGRPVISYLDTTAGALKVAKCANAACTGTATITTVDDPANFVGQYTSIAIGSDGRPVISYYDTTADTLKVAKCANAACTGAATITTVDDPANLVGTYTSLAIGSDGQPVISYHDGTANTLKVAKCANAACTGAATITTVDDPVNFVGFYTSIAIGTDGFPVISYRDFQGNALKVAKCGNAACTGAATITTVDAPANSVGLYTSIAIGTDGLPVISYTDITADALKVAKCANAACTGAATITTVDDSTSLLGAFTSIAIGSDGLPVISYVDKSADSLKVAKCGTRSCQ